MIFNIYSIFSFKHPHLKQSLSGIPKFKPKFKVSDASLDYHYSL